MQTVVKAIEVLGSMIVEMRASSLYQTAPMYLEHQPQFVNAVVVGQTDVGVRPLLLRLKAIESEFGRVATIPNGPRVLDLDMLIFGALIYRGFAGEDRPMNVPHPRIEERRFVLEPLAEIAVDWTVPGRGSVADLAANPNLCNQQVWRIADAAVSV